MQFRQIVHAPDRRQRRNQKGQVKSCLTPTHKQRAAREIITGQRRILENITHPLRTSKPVNIETVEISGMLLDLLRRPQEEGVIDMNRFVDEQHQRYNRAAQQDPWTIGEFFRSNCSLLRRTGTDLTLPSLPNARFSSCRAFAGFWFHSNAGSVNATKGQFAIETPARIVAHGFCHCHFIASKQNQFENR